MKNIIKFILFLLYSSGVFFITDYSLLALVAMINLLAMIAFKINWKNASLNLLKISGFVLFVSLANALFSTLSLGILIGIRLLLVCNMTYIFSKVLTPVELAIVISIILKPLNFLGIDSKDIGMIVCIALSLIPIFSDEVQQIKYSLKAKGVSSTFASSLKTANLLLPPLFVSIFHRIGEIENSLKAKAYI